MKFRYAALVTPQALAVGTCPEHGKLTFVSRKKAKAAAKWLSVREQLHFVAYPCDCQAGWWHFGRLGPTVISGKTDRATRYGRAS